MWGRDNLGHVQEQLAPMSFPRRRKDENLCSFSSPDGRDQMNAREGRGRGEGGEEKEE